MANTLTYDDWVLMSDDEREEWANEIRKGVEDFERNREILGGVVKPDRPEE